jgi:hypothetical protein
MKIYENGSAINFADTRNVLLSYSLIGDTGYSEWFISDIEHTEEVPYMRSYHNIRNYVFDTSYFRKMIVENSNVAIFRVYHPNSEKMEKFIHLVNTPLGGRYHGIGVGRIPYEFIVGHGSPMLEGKL